MMRASCLLALVCCCFRTASAADWAESLLQSRTAVLAEPSDQRTGAASKHWNQLRADFPVTCDWAMQDSAGEFRRWFVADDVSGIEKQLIERAGQIAANSTSSRERLTHYVRLCEQRRARRLAAVRMHAPQFVFTKHRTIRPSFFAYTEGQSDAQHERHFLPGTELCVWEIDATNSLHGRVRTLLADPTGAIRDPAVSWDGKRVVFAWKKSLNNDDYHLYELNLESRHIRQLTSGLGFADYEPAFLPNGHLVFASTRPVQTVDCFWTEVSNLYTCDADGKGLRRLGFDQVHTVYPQVLDDGRVIYSRWDYNDRGQVFPQALFQMNPDGTAQTEFYGNNSWFPTTIAHARGIPGTHKVLATFCGHHTAQAGKLGVLDPAKGRQENSGAQLVAPVRDTPAVRIDQFGQQGELFQYPFPLTTSEFLVTYAPDGWERTGPFANDARFGIYWMNMDGERELLVSDARVPCNQPVPIVARTPPRARPSFVDLSRTNGTFYLQNVYQGEGLAGVPSGTIKQLRVVALDFRAAGIGENHSGGPAGGALASTPVSIGNGSWDVKVVLGDATVHEDGSAFFAAPARTPLYFQALDAKGQAVQTMRSWATLQPGEAQSCVGCHDHKNTAPPSARYVTTMALRAGAEELKPFYGPARGFSFVREIQPILDRHCTRCHDDRSAPRDRSPMIAAGAKPNAPRTTNSSEVERSFSLLADETIDPAAKRRWSDAYLALTHSRVGRNPNLIGLWQGEEANRMVNWIGAQSVPSALPPYFAGAARSELMPLLESGHRGAALSREELEKIACWIDLLVPYCGDYTEANSWTPQEHAKYARFLNKRREMEKIEARNIAELLQQNAATTPRHVSP